MGVSPFRNKICSSSPYAEPNSNPDPKNYKILHIRYIGRYLLIKVHYPDAKNFEGLKILIYKDIKFDDLMEKTNKELDPHFSSDSISPIARFIPTIEGMNMAINFCTNQE